MARCDVTVERIPALIDAWGQASGANPTGKMVISVTDPNREDVVARSVGSNQTVSFNVGNHGVLGTYEIRYSTPHSHKWNLWPRFWHYLDNGQPCIPEIGCMVPEGTPQEFTLYRMQDGVRVTAVQVGDRVFIKPSPQHAAVKSRTAADQHYLTMADLQRQFYDPTIGVDVYDLADYEPGDTVLIRDRLVEVRYDAASDETTLVFSDEEGLHLDWAFRGNLTDRYAAGDTITLKFKVVEYAGEFEILDYMETLWTDGRAPALDNYLVN